MKVYNARNNIHVELIRFRKILTYFIDIGNFEVGPIVFATAVFTSVLVAPDVSGHDHFGTLCTGSSHGKSVQAPILLLLLLFQWRAAFSAA